MKILLLRFGNPKITTDHRFPNAAKTPSVLAHRSDSERPSNPFPVALLNHAASSSACLLLADDRFLEFLLAG